MKNIMKVFLCGVYIGISTICAQGPHTVIDTINSGFQAGATLEFIAISRDGTTAYAPDSGLDSVVYTINVADFSITGTVQDPLGTLNQPAYIAIAPNGTKAYIANGNDSISILDVASNMITGSVTADTLAPFNGLAEIAFTSDSAKAYATSIFNSSVCIIDVRENRVTGSVTDTSGALAQPVNIAIAPDNAIAYVANNANQAIVAINVAQDTVSGTVMGVPAIAHNGIAITGDSATAYVASANNTIEIIDVGTNSFRGTVIDMPPPTVSSPQKVAITPDDTTAYVTNANGTVSIIDLATNKVTSAVTVGILPFGLAITPNGQEVWVINTADTTISIIGYVISSLVNLQGCQARNVFFTQTEFVNVLTWQAPTTGTPVQYIIYRDASLTQVAGTVPATTNPLQFMDHNRNPKATYTYYIVAVDGAGNTSAANVITVNQSC